MCFLVPDFGFGPYRSNETGCETVGQEGERRQAFKAVIIHWKSLVNMQYPFTIRFVRRLRPEQGDNKGQESLNPPVQSEKHFQIGTTSCSKIPQRLV